MRTLETERLSLEPLEPHHAGTLFEGLSDRRLYEFISEEPPATLAALQARYTHLALRRSPDGAQSWLNWALRSRIDGRYVGYVQATVLPRHSAAIAYVLFYDVWGWGFAREAVAVMVRHLRDEYGVRVATAQVDPRHRRSIRLLEALGFRRVGVRSGAEWIKGVLADEVDYQLDLEAADLAPIA